MMPDQTKPFQIECDASKYASGAMLTQLDSNGDCHPAAFLSKTFSKTEHNYEIYDRELLAIIRVLEEWQHYIQGLGHTTISTRIIKTLCISYQLRNSIDNRLGGHCISPNLMWSWSTNLDQKLSSLMRYHEGLTLFRIRTWTMRTWHFCQNTCFWISLMLPCRTDF